ncbi:hypothetical protein F2P81_012023 [Scophthalmus maximus]|uniref:Uncharacterized protein n=1 Tax=Scophthalmus maximus TaxID=52904 RepID=A0A6A4T0B6_SCOMX|nr:hypothetical protein F2P81_012023 [Scophthalmus maximus]
MANVGDPCVRLPRLPRLFAHDCRVSFAPASFRSSTHCNYGNCNFKKMSTSTAFPRPAGERPASGAVDQIPVTPGFSPREGLRALNDQIVLFPLDDAEPGSIRSYSEARSLDVGVPK